MHGTLYDTLIFSDTHRNNGEQDEVDMTESSLSEFSAEELNEEAAKFYKILKEADRPLYLGYTKTSILSFPVRLLHVKCLKGWSSYSFDILLEVLKDLLLGDINMPKNRYESKKQLQDVGMDCIKIDACPNNYMLYWKDGK